MKRCVAVLAALAMWCAWAGADVVHLDDGKTYEGKVTYEGDEVKVTTRMGTLSFPKSKVVKVDKVKSAAEIYKDKAAEVKPSDVNGHYALAQWCREQRLTKEMNQELEKVIALSPDHEDARAALNYVKIDGQWIKARAGMVYVGGDWLKPDDAIEKGKSLYRLEKYEDAYRAFDGAAKSFKRDCDIAEAQFNLGLAAERLGKWDAAKAAYGEILGMKTNVDQKLAAEARKSVIDSSPGGMYLVKEPAGKDDIFSLDNDKKEKQQKLAGLQPLTNPEVMDIALREKCLVFIERGKDLMKQARDANTGTEDGAKKSLALLDKAEEQLQGANRTVPDIARGFLVDCAKQRIEIISKPFNEGLAKVRGAMQRYSAAKDNQEKVQIAKAVIKDLDLITPILDDIQKLAGRYPDELSQQVSQARGLRNAINQARLELAGFIGK